MSLAPEKMSLMAASASIELPSAIGLSLAGYKRPRIAKKTVRGLEANLILMSGQAGKVLMVSIDVLFVGAKLTEMLRQRLPSISVVPFATHTHYAPQVDANKPMLGAFEGEWCSEVANLIVARANDLERELVELDDVSLSRGHVPGSVCRRLATKGVQFSRRGIRINPTLMAPNPAVPIASVGHVARLKSAGKDIALVICWACHPTTNIDPEGASSDYIGHIRDRVRQALSVYDLPVLFLQGFAGDIRPVGGAGPVADADKQRFWSFTPAELANWENAVADEIVKITHDATAGSKVDALELSSHTFPISSFLSKQSGNIELAWLKVTPEWQLFALAAEPSFEHEAEVFAWDNQAWAVGYLGDVFGYLPTDDQVREGGYEVYGYMPLFGVKGRYVGSVNGALRAAVAGCAVSIK